MNSNLESIHPVDEIPAIGKLFAYGFQHVLAMYAGAVAVPIILANALHLSIDDLIRLINADLFTCGIATLIQTLGIKNGKNLFIGAQIPMVQGATFTAVSPMIMIGSEYGMTAIYGSIIVAGLITFLLSPYFSKLIRFFPPVVTGTIVTIMGISLMPVAINWIAGFDPTSPTYANGTDLCLALFTVILVLSIYRFGKGFLSNISVLLGLVGGTILAMLLGVANFSEVEQAKMVAFTEPFAFGFPTFEASAIFAMIIVMLVTMVETTGDAVAIGEIIEKPMNKKSLSACLRADGLSTLIGGIFNSFPYTAFAQNIGLIAVTKIKSRFVVAMAGVILIILGLFPKMAAIVASIPSAVLGGAGLAMFGMIIASGIRSLGKVSFDDNYNLMIVAVSIGAAMIPLAAPNFYHNFPSAFKIIFQSGITLGSVIAIVLNFLFNGIPKETEV